MKTENSFVRSMPLVEFELALCLIKYSILIKLCDCLKHNTGLINVTFKNGNVFNL